MKAKKLRERAATYAPVKTASVTATFAKNEFGNLLETVLQGGAVVITKHDAPKAVMISMDQFNALSSAPEVKKSAKAVARTWDDATAGARAALLARLRAEPVVDVGRWTRAELHEKDR